MKTQVSRRQFMVGCSCAVAALAGARFTGLAFAEPGSPQVYNDEILVVIFLRGGWDALNVVTPIAGADRGHYEAARPSLKVPVSGQGAALPLNSQFGLHPSAGPLFDLYQAGHLAIVHAVGLTTSTRSHFDAMQFIELGTPGNKSTPKGWLTRHLQTAPNLPPTIMMPAISAGWDQAMSLQASREAVTLDDPGNFSFVGHWQYGDVQRTSLRHLYDGDHWLFESGIRTLDTVDLIESSNPGSYTPANGAVYPQGSFGDHLKVAAQMIKLNVGLRVVTVDLGGWDTHEYQGDGSGGYLAGLLDELSQGLGAFYLDLDGAGAANYTQRLTVVAMSEFGRRFHENGSAGTDHGHGNAMFVLGGHTNGGQIYGSWPGLAPAQLFDGDDLQVTTDYRRVLSEVLVRRMGNPNLPEIFPGYLGYQPMNVVQGSDLPIAQPIQMHLPMLRK